jgi:hypothetical protein
MSVVSISAATGQPMGVEWDCLVELASSATGCERDLDRRRATPRLRSRRFIEELHSPALTWRAPIEADTSATDKVAMLAQTVDTPLTPSAAAQDAVAALFAGAAEEHFEDGVETSFSRALVAMMRRGDSAQVQAIGAILLSGQLKPEAAGEALRWLGRLEDSATYYFRRTVLVACLWSAHPAVRDAAGLGLASLDDPAVLPTLRAVLAKEPYAEVCAGFKLVIEQLEPRQ